MEVEKTDQKRTSDGDKKEANGNNKQTNENMKENYKENNKRNYKENDKENIKENDKENIKENDKENIKENDKENKRRNYKENYTEHNKEQGKKTLKKWKSCEKIYVAENEENFKENGILIENGALNEDRGNSFKTTHEESEEYLKMKNDLWWLVFLCVSLLGVATRLHHITMPNTVIWDETHFGKMANWYLNRTFFFDVHPPGGKLLISAFGYLSGYNATFSFKQPGETYKGYEEIIYMRLGCALTGSLMVPLSFLTVWELTQSLLASAFSGLFCCYEIGLITLSKFILLDPLLMTFIQLSFHALCVFHREQQRRSWSSKWWWSLLYTGVSLGITMSVKFVGVFIVQVVGLYTVLDLWSIYSNVKNSLVDFTKHFLARALTLILVPVFVYVFIFFIHDSVLIYSASSKYFVDDLGVATFSSAFQKRLINNSLHDIKQPAEVTYGSVVSLRTVEIGGGYLHSHNITYPPWFGTAVQQVTTLKAKDNNNNFRVLFPVDDPDMTDDHYLGEPEPVLNGNWIRLYHTGSNATVTCHHNKSYVASKMGLVYGRAYNLTVDKPRTKETEHRYLHDYWDVRVSGGGSEDPIRPLQTVFQLFSPRCKCALVWSKEKLPNWGFSQGEVSCTKNLHDPYSFWMVERTTNLHASNVSFDNITTTFLDRLVESHRVMTFMNARLKPEGNLNHIDSPWMWPILYKSAPWYDISFRVVLLGNPLLFLVNLLSLVIAPVILFSAEVKRCRQGGGRGAAGRGQRGGDDSAPPSAALPFALRWLLAAFLFHYVPFFTMQRILYFHHYFPSHSFACMISAILLSEFLTKFSTYFPEEKRSLVLRGLVGAAVLLFTLSFAAYCYVGYGHPTEGAFYPHNSTFKALRFRDEWLI